MTRARRRKCLCCGELFRADPRNLRHQRHCGDAACRKASKAASQRRWLAKSENHDYFRGAIDEGHRVGLGTKNLTNPRRIMEKPATKRSAMVEFDRITHNPDVMGGKPTIRGMRVTVGMIVRQIGAGHTVEKLLADYPYLEREDIQQALRYAAWRIDETELTLTNA